MINVVDMLVYMPQVSYGHLILEHAFQASTVQENLHHFLNNCIKSFIVLVQSWIFNSIRATTATNISTATANTTTTSTANATAIATRTPTANAAATTAVTTTAK